MTAGLVIMFVVTSFSLLYYLQNTSLKFNRLHRSGFAHKLMGLFLQDTDKLYLVINKDLEVMFASKLFKETFSREDFFHKITHLDCLNKIHSIVGNSTDETKASLSHAIDLLFQHSKVIKSHNMGWNYSGQYSQMYPTKAIYQDKLFNLHFSYIEDTTDDLLLFRFDLNNDAPQGDCSSTLTITEIASIVHDLRTPLNGAIFFLNQAMESPEATQRMKQNLLEPSLESAKRLNFIINDLLDFAQILEGKFRLSFEDFDLEKALQVPTQIIKALGKSKGLQVCLEIDHNVPNQITTDQNRLVQIIYNLLGNALKFTKEGSITLQVSLSKEDSQYIDFAIHDTGFGIKPQDLDKLFRTFEKLDNWQDNKVGTGLGLCISNAIVKTLGGKNIQVRSEYETGSTFSFSIENKAPKETFSPLNKPFRKSIFAPSSTSTNISPPSKPAMEAKRNSIAPSNTLWKETILKELAKNPKEKSRGRLTTLESSEVIQESICQGNRTVHFDFNNPSIGSNGSQTSITALTTRVNKDFKRQANTVELPPVSHSRTESACLEKIRRSTLQPEKTGCKTQYSSPTCACYQIVAVDDEPMNLMVLKLICFDIGLRILSFTSGQEAIEYFQKGKGQRPPCNKCSEPILVLMDCNMPGMNGYETATELRTLMKAGKMQYLPIFACSADDSPPLKTQALHKGMDGVFAKPVEKERLESLVKFCVKNFKKDD